MVGPAAVGWVVEKSRILVDRVATKRDFGSLGSHVESRFFEAVSLWGLLRLGGLSTFPESLKSEIGDTVRKSVESGMHVEPLLRRVRFIHAELMQEFFEFCAATLPVAERPAAMQRLSAELFDGMERLVLFVGKNFAQCRARWLAGVARGRITLVNAILEGQPIDLANTVQRLGYDLTLHHVALIVACEEPVPDRAGGLKDTALKLLEAAGCSSTFLLPVGTTRLWAWGGRSTARPTAFRCIEKPLAVPAHIQVFSGLPGDGIAGFRQSHFQARACEPLETVGQTRPAGVHDYGALELLLLLGNEMAAATDFVVRELGPLATDDKATAALRETVLCYLEQERSVAATAELLYVAKNTVLYRVRKAEQLLGKSLRELGEDRLRLHSALYLVQKLGTTMLVPREQEAPPAALPGRRSA
ncbi:PucR family transcriptional regulator [Streptomyces sp. 4F14]|uniref:PucR family transcriptional regulator n=1 Tax=Streptomyces sp. 4F14 TaxID=3394380 RepID=UPI003A8C5208